MLARRFSHNIDMNWKEISSHVKESIVLMDDPTAECLHWNGGLQRLINSEAHSIQILSPFLKTDPKVTKVVFVLITPFTEEIIRTIKIAVQSNSFKTCIIFTSFSEKCHFEIFNELEVFTNLENMLLDSMGNQNHTACVFHVPTFFAQISQCLWIMPAISKSLSIFNCGLVEMNTCKNEPLSFKTLPSKMQSAFKQLSYSLHSVLESNEMRSESFSFGPLSRILCMELESIFQTQKKTYPNKASVVVVDRLLDLAGPLSQSHDTMLHKILLAMPHIKGHTFDVSVSMEYLANCKENTLFGEPLLAPGCIAHRNNLYEQSALNAILCKKLREVLIEVNRSIVDCASKEGIKLDLSSRLNSESLKSRVLAFKQKSHCFVKYNGLLQQALAVVQASEYSNANNVDNLCAVEKALMEYLATSPEEALNNIMQMIIEREDMNYKMESILVFIAFLYMLYQESEIGNESALQATLMELFLQGNMDSLISMFVSLEEKSDENILDTVKTFFGVIKRLSTMWKSLKKDLSLFKSKNPAFPATYDSLLSQLLENMLNPLHTDNSVLESHSTGLRDYIKTGFSLFMNVTKPKPKDNPVIILVVLGGVTASEIKLIHEVSAENKDTEVILVCCGVLKTLDVLKDIGSITKEMCSSSKDDEEDV